MDSRGNLRDAWGRFVTTWQDVEAYQSQIKYSDRLISRIELQNLLRNNVCEVVFVRRRPERAPDRPSIRRMLCTNSLNLLTSYNGKIAFRFNFTLPKSGRRIDEAKHNIVLAWDILMQDYRNISMDQCYIRQQIPDDDTFWKYYNKVLLQMTPQQKMQFMDSVS